MEGTKEQLEKSLAKLVDGIEAKMPKKNASAINAWIDFLRANGVNVKTILKDVYCLRIFSNYLQPNLLYSKATKDQIASAIAKVESSDYSPKTKRNIKITVKAFYKHYLGEDYFYPKQVAWIKAATNGNKKMLPEDILSEDEILKMIEAAGNVRDKAIIAVLYDSGIRVGELLSLRKKDIALNDEPAHIIVNGKTGMRRIPILFSPAYLSRYLELVKKKKPDDYLWTAIGTWTEHNKLVDGSAIRKLLKLVAKKAGIEKRIYPHLFRHSRATNYANKLTEQQLKGLFGWTGDSKMVSTYVHMSGRDIDDAVMQAYGKKPKEVTAPKLVEKICPRCREPNGIDFVHCSRCGSALDIATVMKEKELEDKAAELTTRSFMSQKEKKDVVKRIKEQKSKKIKD